jgi:uncharacterized membrane protein
MLLAIDTTYVSGIPAPILVVVVVVFALIILIRLFKTPGLTGKWDNAKVTDPEAGYISGIGMFVFLGLILIVITIAVLIAIGVFDELLVSQAESGLVYAVNIERMWSKIWIGEWLSRI